MVECEFNSGTDTTTKSYSFNRYMVECEYFFIAFIVAEKAVLIDTWWNVNERIKLPPNKLEKILIDTWWNVNIRLHPFLSTHRQF